MVGRLHHVVIDCPDPAGLAAFYAQLLALPVTYRSEDWVVVAASDTASGLAFQRAPGYQPPRWPDPASSMQFHLDVMVDDVAAAEPMALALGARRMSATGAEPSVYADPAGHPFCLIPRPSWAAPVRSASPRGTFTTAEPAARPRRGRSWPPRSGRRPR